MENKEFVSCGRPMKNKLFYIVMVFLLVCSGVSIMTYGKVITTIMGIIAFVFAAIVITLYILSYSLLRKYKNIIIKDDTVIISPVGTMEYEELNMNEIEYFDFFVLPIFQGNYKETSNYDNQIIIKTKEKEYIVYCKEKEMLKSFLVANYKDKIRNEKE